MSDGEAEMWVMGKQTDTHSISGYKKDPAIDRDGTA